MVAVWPDLSLSVKGVACKTKQSWNNPAWANLVSSPGPRSQPPHNNHCNVLHHAWYSFLLIYSADSVRHTDCKQWWGTTDIKGTAGVYSVTLLIAVRRENMPSQAPLGGGESKEVHLHWSKIKHKLHWNFFSSYVASWAQIKAAQIKCCALIRKSAYSFILVS